MDLLSKTKKALYPSFNILSGLLIKCFKPFHRGDFVVINGIIGQVESAGLHSTKLIDVEGEEVEVANTQFYTKELNNLSQLQILKAEFSLKISYGQDMNRVKQLIVNFLQQQPQILSQPEAKISVKKIYNDHAVIAVIVWTSLEEFILVDSEIEEKLKEHLITQEIQLKSTSQTERKRMSA
mgnify:CR=1 FL=1